MSYFLIVYDRASGKRLDLEEFSSRDEATLARFEREMAERGDAGVEVVVLGASSLDALKRTHARYFETVTSLGHLAAG